MLVTVVSGLPRSGTSMAMQMLVAGGLPVLSDRRRLPDTDNPRGYFEFEPVKRLAEDVSWLPLASGRVVKVVCRLLYALPLAHEYDVVFMRRRMSEILLSQRTMLARAGRSVDAAGEREIAALYEREIAAVLRWMRSVPVFRVIEVWYEDVVAAPAAEAGRIAEFLHRPLDVNAMAAAVDGALYRNRERLPFSGRRDAASAALRGACGSG